MDRRTNEGSSVIKFIAHTLVIIFLMASVFLIAAHSYLNGLHRGQVNEQEKAIRANVGRWEIDAQTGQKQFRYGK